MIIPAYIIDIITKLESANWPAFIVGGCVRDLLMGNKPKDWDIATKASPEEILNIFPDGKYENKFGTVLVPIKKDNGETQDCVEVTTFRSEQGYSDRRHPDKVVFEDKLENDLSRRDFTINAMALEILDFGFLILGLNEAIKKNKVRLIDLFGGQKDIDKKII